MNTAKHQSAWKKFFVLIGSTLLLDTVVAQVPFPNNCNVNPFNTDENPNWSNIIARNCYTSTTAKCIFEPSQYSPLDSGGNPIRPLTNWPAYTVYDESTKMGTDCSWQESDITDCEFFCMDCPICQSTGHTNYQPGQRGLCNPKYYPQTKEDNQCVFYDQY